jgi:hypothetical protein
MKAAIIFGLLGAVVGGVAGSVATLTLGSSLVASPEPRGKAKSKAEEAGAAVGSAVAGEPSDASGRLSKLEHRLALMTRALSQRVGEPQDDEESQEGLLPQGASDVADPVFEAAVLDIMDREQERKTEEQDSYRKELRVERSKRFAAGLSEQLKLSPEEQEKVSQVITDYFESFRQLRDSPERPVTRREWGEKSAELKATLEKQLQESMSAAQFREYQDLPEEDKIGFGPPRGSRGQAREQGRERAVSAEGAKSGH